MIFFTATQQGAAAKQAADDKTAKYQELERIPTCTSSFQWPLRQQTHAVSRPDCIQLVQEIRRCISAITEDKLPVCFRGFMWLCKREMRSHRLTQAPFHNIDPPLQTLTHFAFC